MTTRDTSGEQAGSPNTGSQNTGSQNTDTQDDADVALLRLVREAYRLHDPMPSTLAERALFALQLEDVDAELAKLVDEMSVPAGARGEESARTVTFSSPSLTVTITITPLSQGKTRIDGWVAPAEVLRVELRRQELSRGESGSSDCYTDDDGRFVVPEVPGGLVQLVFHGAQPASDGDRVTVAVPPLEL